MVIFLFKHMLYTHYGYLGSAQSKDATLEVDNMHCLDFASCSKCQGTPDHPSHCDAVQ